MADRPEIRRARRGRATARGPSLPPYRKEPSRESSEGWAQWRDPAPSNRLAHPRRAIADRHARTNCISRCRPAIENRRARGPRAKWMLGVTIICGIAVDDDGRGTVLLGGVDLYSSMAPGITSHYDLATDVDAGGFHFGVVGRQSVVHINHRRLHLPRSRIRDEGRHQLWIV